MSAHDQHGREIRAAAETLAPESVAFLQDLIRIPSFSGQEGAVIQAIRDRMTTLGYDEVQIDDFGNVRGRIGQGPRLLALDAHVDTVGVGDRHGWQVDPFAAHIAAGVVYGRGAADQKAGMAAAVYAGHLIKRLRLASNATVWVVGSVLEEDCDGLCWHYLLNERVLQPDLVILTEPTELHVYRGHRGRMEITLETRGVAAHGSAPERGRNAIYDMAAILAGIEALNDRLPHDAFLGPGSITVSEIRSTAPSLCAVADSCRIHLDRRLTDGETDTEALAQIEAIAATALAPRAQPLPQVVIDVPVFDRPSWRGLSYPMRQYFPAWCLTPDDPVVQLALETRETVLGGREAAGRWGFSTNGVATRGLHGIPTIGFGPGSERHAHAASDQCPLEHIGAAIAFYAAFADHFAQAGTHSR